MTASSNLVARATDRADQLYPTCGDGLLMRQLKNRILALEAHKAALVEALKDAGTSLVAAHSLLSRSSKKAAASDKMFDQMLKDYQASIDRTRATLAKHGGDNG